LSAQAASLRANFLMKSCLLRVIQAEMSLHSGWKPIVVPLSCSQSWRRRQFGTVRRDPVCKGADYIRFRMGVLPAELALPDGLNQPSECAQLRFVATVACLIGRDLRLPEIRTCLW